MSKTATFGWRIRAIFTYWRFAPVMAEGRLALLGADLSPQGGRWLAVLDWRDGQIAAIRDFLFAAYVIDAIEVSPVDLGSATIIGVQTRM